MNSLIPPTGFTIKPLNSFLQTHMKKPITYIIGSLSILTLAFGYIAFTKAEPVVPAAEASIAPEAIAIAETLKDDIAEYEQGDAMVRTGTKMRDRAAAAAKGKDLTLCADFDLVFDRTTQKLVTDVNCPLL